MPQILWPFLAKTEKRAPKRVKTRVKNDGFNDKNRRYRVLRLGGKMGAKKAQKLTVFQKWAKVGRDFRGVKGG